MTSRMMAAAVAMAPALSMPATATASSGPGGGGTPPPTVTDAPCAELVATPPSLVVNRKAQVALSFTVRNCSASEETVQTQLSGTAETVGADGALATCDAASWTADALTLRPHETRGFSTIVPSSACPLGTTGATFTFLATTVDTTDGSVLSTATATVRVTLGF